MKWAALGILGTLIAYELAAKLAQWHRRSMNLNDAAAHRVRQLNRKGQYLEFE